MGVNGGIRVTCHYAITGASNTKTVKVKFGGTDFANFVFAAGETINGTLQTTIWNQASASVQIGAGFYQGPTGACLGLGHTAGAINTAVAQNVTVTGTTPNAGDEVTAKATSVEIIPAL
jgi:hypothetical protein